MREIKFRVWNPSKREMEYEPELPYRGEYGFNEQFRYYASSSEAAGEAFYNVGGKIMLQYIGVKDKNGKEIYEGDILRYSKYPFDVGTAVCEVKSEITGNCGCCGDVVGWDFPASPEDCEVIGNIYENPELLEAIK